MTPYYTDDLVTIYNADCRDVLPSIDPATVDLLLTDPPYGMHLDTDNTSRGGRAYDRVHGDDEPFDPAPLLRYGRCVLWGANYYASRLPDSGVWLAWDKREGVLENTNADFEVAWTNLPGPSRLYAHRWAGFLRASERGVVLHPTQKPVALMRWIVDRWTEPGDLVLDPYMGSGPVAQACHELRRRYIGVELVEEYCRVAVSRLRQQTLDLDAGSDGEALNFGGVA